MTFAMKACQLKAEHDALAEKIKRVIKSEEHEHGSRELSRCLGKSLGYINNLVNEPQTMPSYLRALRAIDEAYKTGALK